MKTNLENWMEWRKLCAMNLCSSDTKKRLSGFIDRKFYWYAQKYAGRMTGLTARELVGNSGNC
jgi:hypothetical protein